MVSIPQLPTGKPARPPVGPSSQKPRKRKRRWIFRLFWLMLALLILVGLLPYLASSVPVVRNFLLARAMPNLNGSITAEGASLGWEKPISFQDISIHSRSKMPVIEIDELTGNRPLWKILLKPSVLGTYTLKKPRLTIVVYPNGTTNLTEVFTGTDPMTMEPSKPKEVPDVSLAVRLVDGSVKVCNSMGEIDWIADPINFAFRIRPSPQTPDGRTWLDIPAGKVFDHVQVTPQISQGMLRYIAPVMADATETEGSFSIDLSRWNLPLDAPGEGTGKGVFTVHKLSISAGPIVEEILTTLLIPSELVSIDEAPIQFELVDGRMNHKGLQFHVGPIKFTTSGSVGVKDKTLDMTMVVKFPKKVKINWPIAKGLAGQSFTIPIRGTLSEPEVDLQKLGQINVKAILETIKNVAQSLDDEETKTPTGAKEDSVEKPAIDAIEILKNARELIRRRRERLKKLPLLPPTDKKPEDKKTSDALPADDKKTLEVPPEIDPGVVLDSVQKLLRSRQSRMKENTELSFPFVNPQRDRPRLDRLIAPPEEKNQN